MRGRTARARKLKLLLWRLFLPSRRNPVTSFPPSTHAPRSTKLQTCLCLLPLPSLDVTWAQPARCPCRNSTRCFVKRSVLLPMDQTRLLMVSPRVASAWMLALRLVALAKPMMLHSRVTASHRVPLRSGTTCPAATASIESASRMLLVNTHPTCSLAQMCLLIITPHLPAQSVRRLALVRRMLLATVILPQVVKSLPSCGATLVASHLTCHRLHKCCRQNLVTLSHRVPSAAGACCLALTVTVATSSTHLKMLDATFAKTTSPAASLLQAVTRLI